MNCTSLQKALALFLIFPGLALGQNELNVVNGKWIRYSDPSHLLYHHVTQDAYTMLANEAKTVESLTTKNQWKQRQKQKKDAIWNQIGGFQKKTPLNAKIISIVQKEDFRVENLIYESLPGFYVTASLFIPRHIDKPAPAILFCSGHSAQAYRRDVYQLPLQNLVKKGFVVLAIDPVGQGERLQYLDPEKGESKVGSSTKEHSYPTVQSFLIGQSTARYFAWDGIRGIDYLTSRKEVDPDRIGVHGLSGGGTQTAYISALDERVVASAPAGYITGFARLLESIGVQDGEQNFYHGIKEGIDHADLLEIRAPKPTLIMATTRDFFNISGTRDVFTRVKKLYRLLGAEENFGMVEGDYEHGYEQTIREGMYAFFQKHLKQPGSSGEVPVTMLTPEELQKTPTGQIASSYSSFETIFTLNKKESDLLFEKRAATTRNTDISLKSTVEAAKKYSGFRQPESNQTPVFTGRLHRDRYVIERYFLKGEGDYPIPYLLFIPSEPSEKTVIYLHPDGKNKEASGEIEQLVREGLTVLAPDLLGVGELTSDRYRGDASIEGVSYNIWFTAALTGRSIVGIHAADLIRLVEVIKQANPQTEVSGIARGQMGPSLLHAAAFDQRIARIALDSMYSSYQSFVENEYYKTAYVYSLVPGALEAYDLPDLEASLAPRQLLISNSVNSNGIPLNIGDLNSVSSKVVRQYELQNAASHLKIENGENFGSSLIKWIR